MERFHTKAVAEHCLRTTDDLPVFRRCGCGKCHHEAVTLPPTLDAAIRLIRRQHGSITVGELADSVIARGWNVDRALLIGRIRELFPEPMAASAAPPSASQRKPPASKTKVKRTKAVPGVKKKRPKTKFTEDYCSKCHAYVLLTRFSGVTTVANHVTKKGEICSMSGKPFTATKPLKRDAMELRVPGSFGTGKSR